MMIRILALTAFLATPGLAQAAGLTIAVAAPQSGPYALLGEQIATGARFQIEAAGNTVLTVGESCEEGGGEEIAKQVISGGATAVIGFLCSESLWESLPALKEAGIPAITLSVRSPILFEDAAKKNWPLFSIAPADDDEEAAVTEIILSHWAAEPFALLDDGTIRSRELAANIRARLEEKGLAPTLVDGYRPALENQVRLVRRLEKAGISRVFISGDRKDIAVIASDAQSEKTGLLIMGGETMLAGDDQTALPAGVLAILPEPWRDQPQASAIVGALSEEGVVVEGYILPANAAASIAGKAGEQAEKEEKDIAAVLASETFATAIGPVSFNEKHSLDTNRFALYEWRNGAFGPVLPKADTN